MCTGCMTHADFLATSGILGVASLRVGARMAFGPGRRSRDKVSDAEAREFLSSLQPPHAADASPPAPRTDVGHAAVQPDLEPSRLG